MKCCSKCANSGELYNRILFDIKNCGESVVDASEKIRNIIDKEVNKAVNEIYK